MPSHLYKQFEESGRLKKVREYIDSPECKPNLRRLLGEMVAIIDLQHHIIMNDDDVQQEYKELCRESGS